MIDIACEPDFDFDDSEYADLFASAAATSFQHPVWLGSLYRDLAPKVAAEPIPVTVREQATGELLALFPLMRIRRRGVRIVEFADLGVCDYCAPVVRNGKQQTLHDQDDLAENVMSLIGPCDLFRIKSVRPEHAKLVEDIIGVPPLPAGFAAHEAPLEAPYDEWRQKAFGKSRAKYIDRKRRRFDRMGNTTLELITDPASVKAAIAELRELRIGRFQGDPIQQEPVLQFYQAVAVRGCSDGYARTYRLTENGNLVGVLFGTAYRGRFSYLLIGCDYQAYSKHSPGLLMYDQIMAEWLDAGGDIFDFTIGDEAFKGDFGTRPVQMSTFSKAVSVTGRVADSVRSIAGRFA